MELDELGIDIEAQNCLDQIQQESRTSAVSIQPLFWRFEQ